MSAVSDGNFARFEDARHPWRPIFWEPVSGTGERLLAGVLYDYQGAVAAVRFLRDDTLDALFGKQSRAASRLIDQALNLYQEAARGAGGVRGLPESLLGMHAGTPRLTAARSLSELLRTAALMHSSLTNLDKLDELEEGDAPLPEEVNRRFGTEVREQVLSHEPGLINYFGRTATLVDGGQPVRFGFCSPRLVAHFNVFHAARPSASLRDSRARLFELQSARRVAWFPYAVLISAVNRDDDATLGERQRTQLAETRAEIREEAESAGVMYRPVHTSAAGASVLLEMAA
ncbi:hypothetical protein [Luteimonas sp. SDU82]|uniref:hypothetical protein n=1 Tax=Luteimonas sp. SDU82 TaxID=3422592 RepID=UPI003EB702D8